MLIFADEEARRWGFPPSHAPEALEWRALTMIATAATPNGSDVSRATMAFFWAPPAEPQAQ